MPYEAPNKVLTFPLEAVKELLFVLGFLRFCTKERFLQRNEANAVVCENPRTRVPNHIMLAARVSITLR